MTEIKVEDRAQMPDPDNVELTLKGPIIITSDIDDDPEINSQSE
jgi:hypothetical protein